jgi:ring-1,2-phenylacetyl-CoA epoxidase subunit PaaD
VVKNNTNISEEYIWEQLGSIMDPEIPKISVVDLGMIVSVKTDQNNVDIKMTPTFAACPALNVIRLDIFNAIDALPATNEVNVEATYDVQWDSNLISDKGRQILKDFGLAPPEKHTGDVCFKMLQEVECPFCDSHNTTMKSTFGSTLCRAIHYCNDCKQSFEQFKPV